MRGGVFTLAVTLMGTGAILLAANLGYLRLLDVLRWWPVILVLLGVEILVRQAWVRARGGPGALAWDRAAIVLVVLLCLLLAGGQSVAALLEGTGISWAWEAGWIPGVKAEKLLTDSLAVDAGVRAVEIAPALGRTVQVVGEGDRVVAELSVVQPGRTQQEASRLAEEWRLRLERSGDTVFVRVDSPLLASGRSRATSRLVVRVPVGLAVSVTNEHGGVDVTGVAACRVHNRFGGVRVKGVTGAVEVRNEHGPVTVEWTVAPASEVRLETEFAPLEVYLPEGTGVQLDAETRFGRIDLPSGWNVSTEVREPDYASARGTVGQGGFPLVLRNRHGPISVRVR